MSRLCESCERRPAMGGVRIEVLGKLFSLCADCFQVAVTQ